MDENLFEEELTIEALSAMGNPLEQLSALVDFEMFRPELEDILVKKDCKSTAGRPQFDVVLMFKVIFLQRYYGLGDKQIQYQIIDRTSFRQFLGIHTVDEIPDEKTVWHVKNILSKVGSLMPCSTSQKHRHRPCQGSHGSHLSRIQHIQICANQQIPAAVFRLYGIAVS